jgi:hypothetical protein
MAVLKFRVMYEDDDSVFRDVEILSAQSLLNFESVIIQAFNLPVSEKNEFFLSNDQWHILHPILKNAAKTKAPSKSKPIPALIAYIDDPHQKFIFKYSGISDFTFLAELLSIAGQEKKDVPYPLITRKQGPSPYKRDDSVVRAVPAPVPNHEAEDHDEEPAEEAEEMEEWIDSESTENLASVSEEEMTGEEPKAEESEEAADDKDFEEEDLDENSGDDFGGEFGNEGDSLEE